MQNDDDTIKMTHEIIDNLRIFLAGLAQEEYNQNGYVPSKMLPKSLHDNKSNNEYETIKDINKMKTEINKMLKKKETRTNKMINKVQETNVVIMNNTSDIFNIIDGEKKYLDWRKLSPEEKVEILEYFFQNDSTAQKYGEPLKDELRIMVQSGKLATKKKIVYDAVNKKILEIPIVKCLEDGSFIVQEEEKKVNIRTQNISNINRLFKKK